MRYFRCYRLIVCLFLSIIIFSVHQLNAQDILKGKDLTTLKVDELSDDDIIKYKAYLQQSGISQTQAEQIAIQKGLSSSEIIKLRARLARLETTGTTKSKAEGFKVGRTVDSSQFPKRQPLQQPQTNKSALQIFGNELFANDNMTFEPDLRIPTPKNYVLGPDDEIAIDVFGYQETNQRLTVSAEGSINIPGVGIVPVNALTVEQATKRIKDKMVKNGYASLGSGQSQLQVNISKIRSIKVNVIGEAKRPGTYTLSSLSTLFNALYAAGGVSERGSLRQIKLIRNSKVIDSLDAYQFLLNGDQSHDVRLMDRDVIRIPVAKTQVLLTGEIKKPAIYEMLKTESLNDLFEFSGGFTSSAYTASVHINQVTSKERKVKDIEQSQYNSYHPNNGDEINIERILNRYTNRVSIDGAVYRPGQYELLQGLTLSQLIKKADGLKEDAFKERGVIIRTNEDLTKQVIAFNPIEIISAKANDFALQKEDSVLIGSTTDFRDEYTVTIDGEIRRPGVYKFYEGESLKDALFQAGGFTDASSIDKIEIARRLDSTGSDTSSKQLSQVIEVATEKDLNAKGSEFKLKPWDVILVRKKPNYSSQVSIKIEGEVLYPGAYILSSKQDKVSGILKRAGGLTPQAFLKGIYITRINTSILKDTSDEQLKKIQQRGKDSSETFVDEYKKPTVRVGLDVQKILEHPGGVEDILLQEGDVLNVPKEKREIKITGEVLFPTEVVFVQGESLDYYIDKSGGFTDNAKKSKVFVLKPNGVAAKTKHFLFFKTYPKVEAGSEIFVPKKRDTNKRLSTGEVIGITTALASMAGVLIALVSLLKQ
jgi:protein involved in polysaccharide export with SLBB domain